MTTETENMILGWWAFTLFCFTVACCAWQWLAYVKRRAMEHEQREANQRIDEMLEAAGRAVAGGGE